jgi:hypothetical protein
MAVVYLHRHNGTPIWAGTSSPRRPFAFSGPRCRNKLWREHVEKHGKPSVEILFDGLTKEVAWAIEMLLVEQYGRAGIEPNGTLLNRGTGGRCSGAGVIRDSATRAKVGAAQRGRKRAAPSPEWRARHSLVMTGKKQSPETIAKRIESSRNRTRESYANGVAALNTPEARARRVAGIRTYWSAKRAEKKAAQHV